MPPSSEQRQETSRGAATPSEQEFAGISLAQAGLSLDAQRAAITDPRVRAATLDSLIGQRQGELDQAKAELAEVETHWARDRGAWIGGLPATQERLSMLRSKMSGLTESIGSMQAEKQFAPERVATFESEQDQRRQSSKRVMDILEGRDLGVSPEERALITQGISGISQDVATTRGLNRSDTPVMQAIAPAISQALLAQANANRSLFTGINQFQQGMGLSNRQLQAGLAGQNPAANLTGVYSGLRSTSMTGSTQQNYGLGDYLDMTGKFAQGIGGFMYGMNAGGGGGGGGLGKGGGYT